MAKYLVEDTSLTAIADVIRNHTETEDLIALTDMPAAMEVLYNEGYDEGYVNGFEGGRVKGHEAGYAEGYEAGCAEGGGGSIWDKEYPDDGKTRIFIHLSDGRTSPMLGCCPKGTVTVDWGDGTESDILTGTNIGTIKYTPTHKYAEPGDYIITLTVDGSMGIAGVIDSMTLTGSAILRHSNRSHLLNVAYQSAVLKIVIGDNATIGNGAFAFCYGLQSVTCAQSVADIAAHAFYGDTALANVNFGGTVTNIVKNSFSYCTGIRYLDFSACASIPTLNSGSEFAPTAGEFEIRVPSALYDEWIAATNWANYADYIVAV